MESQFNIYVFLFCIVCMSMSSVSAWFYGISHGMKKVRALYDDYKETNDKAYSDALIQLKCMQASNRELITVNERQNALFTELFAIVKQNKPIPNRLQIAAQLFAGCYAAPEFYPDNDNIKDQCEYFLRVADTLIRVHNECVPEAEEENNTTKRGA